MRTKAISILFVASIMLLPASAAVAATNAAGSNGYTPLSPLPCISGGGYTCGSGQDGVVQDAPVNFSNYVQYMFNLVIAISAAAAIFMLVYGGLKLMTTDSWEGKNEGKKKIYGALEGLLLVLTSYIILRTIDPRLVAVPTTLVPSIASKLNMNGGAASFLATLDSTYATIQQEAAQYHADVNAINSDLAQSKSQLNTVASSLQTAEDQVRAVSGNGLTADEINSLCSDVLSSNNTSDPAYAPCLQTQKLTDQATELQGQVSLQAGISLMRSTVNYCGTTGEGSCFSNALNNIQNIYKKYSGQLQPNQATQLQGYAAFAMNWNYVNAAIVQSQNSGVPTVNSQAANQIIAALHQVDQSVTAFSLSKNADPTIVEQMKSTEQQLIKTIGGWPGWGGWKM